MLGALDFDVGPENRSEQFELTGAEVLTGGGGVADGAVVFGEHEPVVDGGDLGHVPLTRAEDRQARHPHLSGVGVTHGREVGGFESLIAAANDGTETGFAQRLTGGRDEVDGEVGVTVGEQLGRQGGEPPGGGRATPPAARLDVGRLDQTGGDEGVEVLAHRCRRDVEITSEIARRDGPATFELIDDASLGCAWLGHGTNRTN